MAHVHPLDAASQALDESAELLRAATSSHERAAKVAVNTPFATPLPTSEHPRAHRPGKPRKVHVDAGPCAFIIARIDALTFPELAEAVSAHFPVERRVGKSAIHACWKRQPKG